MIASVSYSAAFSNGHAPRLAEYIESEPLRKKAQQEAQRAKLEALEKKLGIAPGSSSEPVAGKKHRLEDTEYVEQSRDIVENVKSAVSVGTYATDEEIRIILTLISSHAEEEKEGEDVYKPTC